MIADSHITTNKIRDLANSHGFDMVGFASAEPFDKSKNFIVERVDEGLLSGLSWFTKERVERGSNPKNILADAKSIISLGLSYYTTKPEENRDSVNGKIAMYAWGDDYHRIFERKIKDFIVDLKELTGKETNTHWYTDTGPMSDRAVAQRAGVGWFGKNTNILTNKGSWVVLAQIITNLDLEESLVSKKHCGTCTMCIDACPTDAIIGPGILDNNKCISYLTIEHKGPIPIELRSKMGNWIFGCDICQDVCPVNRKQALGQAYNSFSQKDSERVSPDLISLLKISEKAFRERFAKSPVLRAKVDGIKRNVCVALGNIKDPSTVEHLSEALIKESTLVRGHAAWALGQIKTASAIRALTLRKKTEKDLWVLEEIDLALDAETR
ncbi:MAG: tRNA epoxyqueuosine(34) reductase QueG [Dehalococcoidia bacterium]|tara:strand:+ start:1885 stop:3030 length:1146 start_codon:yes stop_codon:yes gene_type:complete